MILNKLNIVIMGKTGAGKSTLLNAIMDENLAPTGTGQAITKENIVYSKKILLPLGEKQSDGCYGMIGKQVNLYDTVGLEIDRTITNSTLKEIHEFIKLAQNNELEKDITVVLFCVNYRSSRFETYEMDLIRNLSIDYEIPFVIALTQCIDDEIGELEKQIRHDLPEITLTRVLAKDYKTKGGTVEAFGATELLRSSILDYDNNKVTILESKLIKLQKEKDIRIQTLRENGQHCVDRYSDKAMKIGFVPVGCIPIVHGMCIKMLVDLNSLVGINSAKEFATDIFADAIVGVIATPFMAVPILSACVATAYIGAVGETYLNALTCVIERSNDWDLKNNELMSKRIREELKRRKE